MEDDASKDWSKEIQARVDCLEILASQGERYSAFSCDRIGSINRELIAINKAGWTLHSIVPFDSLSLDRMTYFCIVAERE